jgi:hypothetical protein
MSGTTRRILVGFTAALLLALPATLHAAESRPDQSSAMRLHLPGAIESSLDAIPLGNGLCGGLLWGNLIRCDLKANQILQLQ